MYTLPYTVNIDGENYKIRNKCDFRVILDVIEALNDNELTEQEKMQCSLFIFYENQDLKKIKNWDEAIKQMFIIVNGGEETTSDSETKAKLMDWKFDFKYIAPPVNRILGYDVRTPDKFCHWYTFLGAYMEIGECTFQNIVSIRNKRKKGKKLEKWEQEFYNSNRKIIDLPHMFTEEEKEWLDSDW